jgi:hypothetical protein
MLAGMYFFASQSMTYHPIRDAMFSHHSIFFESCLFQTAQAGRQSFGLCIGKNRTGTAPAEQHVPTAGMQIER